MNWGHPQRAKVILFVGDALLTTLAILVASQLHPVGPLDGAGHGIAVVVFLLTFLASFYVFDLYNLSALNGANTVYRLVVAGAAATVLCSTWFYFFPWLGNNRGSLMLSGPALLAIIYAWRRVYARNVHRFALREPVLVIGSPYDAASVRAVVSPENPRYDLMGFLRLENGTTPLPENGDSADGELVEEVVTSGAIRGDLTRAVATVTADWPVPGQLRPKTAAALPTGVADLGWATAEHLHVLVAAYGVRSLVVRSDSVAPELASALTRLRFQGIRVYPLLDFHMKLSEELSLEVLSDTWLCFADGFDLLHARLFRKAKRLTDLLLASVGLLLSLPILLVAAIAIKLDSRGPLLFRQWRVGWMDRPFELWKLRSMRDDAESDGRPQWASVNDRRVTPVGRILRKLHVDELPQMVNILRGEMSFVGPRPERPEFVEQLTAGIPFYHLRHYVPPGITGWAQVKYPYGASVEDARRKLQFDLYYIRNASPLLDLRILLRTARVVLFRQGSR